MTPEYRAAIGGVESNNNYQALGPETDDGDRAYGRYQVMGENIPDWTQKHLGKSMTPQEFLANPDAQDKVFDGETSAHYKKYGNLNDVTSTWFSGRPMAQAGNDSDGYNTVPQYVAKVNARMGNPTAMQTAMSGRTAMASTDDDAVPPALNPGQPQGALTAGGSPVAQAPNWLDALGNTLMNMAPGIAQDPENKKALVAAAAEANKGTAGSWSSGTFNKKTGMTLQTNTNGQTRFVKTAPADDGDDEAKWGVIGKDKYGQPLYGYPPARSDYAAKKDAPAATDADTSAAVALTGQPFLDNLLKDKGAGYQSQVQSILDGRTPYPTGMLLKTPFGQQLAQDVTQADPSYEAGNPMARVKTRNEFMTGGVASPAGQITAGNTALQHAGEMSDALEKFKGGGADYEGTPFVSYYMNKLHNNAIQGTAAGSDYNDFMTAKNHFSEEVTKFYAGSAGSEGERKRALANLDEAKSLPELRSAIKEETDLMNGKVSALQDRWKTGMGPMAKDFPLIQPKSQEAIDRITQRNASPASSTSAPTASKPMKTSNGVTWSIN